MAFHSISRRVLWSWSKLTTWLVWFQRYL